MALRLRPVSLLWLALLIGLSGCTPESPLRIGTNRWPGYEPLYLARAQGWLPPQQVRLVELPSSTEVLQYLNTGTLEGGGLTLDETLSLCAQGVPMKVVLILDISNGGDALLARPGIESLGQLRGRRIGVESSAVGAVMLQAVLEAAGLTTADIEMVPLTADQHLAAYLRGDVDAVVTFEPMRSQLIAQGARLLFDSSRVPGLIIDVLAVRAPTVRSHRRALNRLTAGYFLARRFMAEHPQQSAAIMAPRLGLSPEGFLRTLEGLKLPGLEENRRWLQGPHAQLPAIAAKLQEIMQQNGLLEGHCNTQTLADPGFLPSG